MRKRVYIDDALSRYGVYPGQCGSWMSATDPADPANRKEITVTPLVVKYYAPMDLKEAEIKARKHAIYQFAKMRYPGDRVGEVDIISTSSGLGHIEDIDILCSGIVIYTIKYQMM